MAKLHENCRDCIFRAERSAIYGCNYYGITGHTRKGKPAGAGCPYKLTGKRIRRAEDWDGRDGISVRKVARPKRINTERALQMHRGGASDLEIARVMGVSGGAVWQWRAKLGLPPNKGRKTDGEHQGPKDVH